MGRTMEQWQNVLTELCLGTKYEAVKNGGKGSAEGVAIVPFGSLGPQRVCVYPKKTIGAGLVVEMDIYNKFLSDDKLLGKYRRLKSNRPHYSDLRDSQILVVCSLLLDSDL